MAKSRSNFVYVLTLFAAALAFGVAHRAHACPEGMSDSAHLPCCDGMDRPPMDSPGIQHSVARYFDCAMARSCPQSCTSSGHCVCGQPWRVAQVIAREVHPASHLPLAVLAWPEPPVSEDRIPPPQGPPDEGAADPPCRHTYLATRR